MLITKTKNKENNKTYINFIFDTSFVKLCKNEKFCRVSISDEYEIGIGFNEKILIKNLNIKTLKNSWDKNLAKKQDKLENKDLLDKIKK